MQNKIKDSQTFLEIHFPHVHPTINLMLGKACFYLLLLKILPVNKIILPVKE